jgi:hypothetical protein
MKEVNMSIKMHRALNAFVLGFLGTGGALLIDKEADIQDAVAVGDWTALRFLLVPLIGGAIAGGIRRLQSGVPSLVSPEPEENKPSA